MANFNAFPAHIVRAPVAGPRTQVPGGQMPSVLLGSVRIGITGTAGFVAGVTGMYGVSAAFAATGVYSLTFPQIPSGGDLKLQYGVQVGSGPLTIQGKDCNVQSGIANFTVSRRADGLGSPAAGDQLTVFFYVDPTTLDQTVP